MDRSPIVSRSRRFSLESIGSSNSTSSRQDMSRKPIFERLRHKNKQSKDGIDDPDPMMQALYGNILSLEQVLMTLHKNVVNFVRAANFVCLNMQTLASNISIICAQDEALAEDTVKYAEAVSKMSGSDASSTRGCFVEHMEMKVLEPINVNLSVLADVKKRMMAREGLRKEIQRRRLPFGGKTDPKKVAEFETLTRNLFDELTALFQHRFDFVRAPYQALKRYQHEFFADLGQAFDGLQEPAPRPATSAEPPKAPPPKASKSATEMSKNVVDSKKFLEAHAANNTSFRGGLSNVTRLIVGDKKGDDTLKQSQPVEEPIVPIPENTGFNPDADRPSAGTAYLRLGRARGAEAIGTKLNTAGASDSAQSIFRGASEVGAIKINLKGRRSSRFRAARESEVGETPVEVMPNGDIPMKIAPAGEIPMKIAPSGEIPMKVKRNEDVAFPSGEIPMKIAPSGEVPMKIAPSSGEIIMKLPPGQKWSAVGKKKRKKKSRRRKSTDTEENINEQSSIADEFDFTDFVQADQVATSEASKVPVNTDCSEDMVAESTLEFESDLETCFDYQPPEKCDLSDIHEEPFQLADEQAAGETINSTLLENNESFQVETAPYMPEEPRSDNEAKAELLQVNDLDTRGDGDRDAPEVISKVEKINQGATSSIEDSFAANESLPPESILPPPDENACAQGFVEDDNCALTPELPENGLSSIQSQ